MLRKIIDILKEKFVLRSILAPNGKIRKGSIGRRYLPPQLLKPCHYCPPAKKRQIGTIIEISSIQSALFFLQKSKKPTKEAKRIGA